MRKFILTLFKSIIILYILNILTNNYFTFNILNIFILIMLGYPGIIIIYFISQKVKGITRSPSVICCPCCIKLKSLSYIKDFLVTSVRIIGRCRSISWTFIYSHYKTPTCLKVNLKCATVGVPLSSIESILILKFVRTHFLTK